MAGISNNLYPPIVATWMPAFVRTSECRVYFSLSSYNSVKDLQNENNKQDVQIMISNQSSSLSALDSDQYPANIKLAPLEIDDTITGDDKYYITISPSDLRDGIFEVGQYYKVQLRFTGANTEKLSSKDKIAKWLSDNQQYFSEWSTVCLVKGIEKPEITIRDLDPDEEVITQLTTQVIDIIGRMYYEENEELEDEYLKYYEINIVDENTNKLAFQSGLIYTNEFYPNEINYTLRTNLTNRTPYNMEFIYTTNNGYSDTIHYRFMSVIANIAAINATITATPDEENGRIAVHVVSSSSQVFLGNLCIRRASSETNYSIWDDINITTYTTGTMLNYTWYDYTVKSGVYYHYCVQKITSRGLRGRIVQTNSPTMLYLDDMFLTTEDMQLRIRYNPGLSSYKINIVESKTDTIGSKYPFIRRNGNVAYKTFPITGLITGFCDSDNLFSSRSEFFGDEVERYNDYNKQEQISEYKDFLYEREFREKIIDFLNDSSVKLFRSLPEGNVLVRLMEVSFTPNATLGRMLYEFSATAYEIDECSLENYNKYHILSIGEYQSYIEYDSSVTGQIFGLKTDTTYSVANINAKNSDITTFRDYPVIPYENIVDKIAEFYSYNSAEGFLNEFQYLIWVRIEFQSEPYLIRCGEDGSLSIIDSSTKLYDMPPEPPTGYNNATDNIVSGYIVYINGEAILVSGRRYYELNDPDTIVTSIYFPNSIDVVIDYTAYLEEYEDVTRLAKKIYSSIRVGQLWGTFDVNDSVLNQIYTKYYLNYTDYYEEVEAIDRITVEAEPGSIIYLKDSYDDDYYVHEVGETGVLDFYDEEATIQAIYFGGVHLNEMKDYERLQAEDWEYRETGITVNSVDEIEYPERNGVYTILTPLNIMPLDVQEEEDNKTLIDAEDEEHNNEIQQLADSSNRYIYYRNQWYTFTDDDIVMCPVQGLVDYIYELLRGEY